MYLNWPSSDALGADVEDVDKFQVGSERRAGAEQECREQADIRSDAPSGHFVFLDARSASDNASMRTNKQGLQKFQLTTAN